jgi:ADP-ribosylglycohydrolase
VAVAAAVGDALGAGYEFATPPGPGSAAEFRVGTLTGGAPGTWTDDTELTWCVLDALAEHRAARGAPVRADDPAVGDGIAARFSDWFDGDPADVGSTTAAAFAGERTAAGLTATARAHQDRTGRGAGNGSLMRTGPVALATVAATPGAATDAAIAAGARAVSDLTHGDPEAGDACVLWSVAIDRAARSGRLDGIRDGLALIPDARRARWERLLDDAATRPPTSFTPNGYAPTALAAALAAIWQTPVPAEQPCRHLEASLHTVIGVGDDTDTTAAIAGGLLGAAWGATAVPWRLRRHVRGWPGLRAGDLGALAVRVAHGDDPAGWPSAVDLSDHYRRTHPAEPFAVAAPGDDDLILGNVAALGSGLVDDVDAVVSLCRIGAGQRRADHHEFWLVDHPDRGRNPNLDFVLADAAEAVCTLRNEGKRVFLHCVAGASRTPTVAAFALARRRGIRPQAALDEVAGVLPVCVPNPTFASLLASAP